MRHNYLLLSLLFLLLAIFFIILGVSSGEVEFGVVLIFPFFVGTGLYAAGGIFCLFIAFLLSFFGFSFRFVDRHSTESDFEDKKTETSVKGGVIFIGPLPIVFGSNYKIALVMMIIAIIIITSFFIFNYFL